VLKPGSVEMMPGDGSSFFAPPLAAAGYTTQACRLAGAYPTRTLSRARRLRVPPVWWRRAQSVAVAQNTNAVLYLASNIAAAPCYALLLLHHG
jgi:hypothetical protein